MLKWINRVLASLCGRPQRNDMLAKFDFAVEGQTLIIRPRTRQLGMHDLQELAGRLRGTALRCYKHVRFDFSPTQTFDGPWGAHFATLVHLAAHSDTEVKVSGLRSQPAALAWMFRNSAQVRALFSKDTVKAIADSQGSASCAA